MTMSRAPLTVLVCLSLLAGCGHLRRRGAPIAEWRGGQYIGAECNDVMCLYDDRNREHVCARDRMAPSVRERILMAVCVPRHVTARTSRGAVSTDERHRFQLPPLEEAHRAFDDRRYQPIEAALLATSFGVRESTRERGYLRTVYAHLVTDESWHEYDAALTAQIVERSLAFLASR